MPISDEQLHKIIQSVSDSTLVLHPKKDGEEFNDADVIKLVELLNSRGINVKKISLYANDVGDKGAEALAELKTLEELDVSNDIMDDPYGKENHITAIGARALANSKLTKLIINRNPIGDEGSLYLGHSKTITELEAEGCDITSKGAAEFFHTDSPLRKLNLSSNNIKNPGVETVYLNPFLEELNLSHCDITAAGTVFIAKCPALTTLNLTGNKIGGDGGQTLAMSSTLVSLDVDYCELGDAGIAPFGKNTKLKELSASRNGITSRGIKDGLAESVTLTTLDLRNNHLDAEGLEAALSMKSLTWFSAAYNKIGEQAIKVLEKMKPTSSVECLDLTGNPMKHGAYLTYLTPKRKREETLSASDSSAEGEPAAKKAAGDVEKRENKKDENDMSTSSSMSSKKKP
jgi:Leucine-rich repeat (LRR) protein